jgi:hypothetical protein
MVCGDGGVRKVWRLERLFGRIGWRLVLGVRIPFMRAMIIFEANILFVGFIHLGKSRTGCMNE